MVKYRRLKSEELNELSDEFVEFLVVNGIVASDWEKMKKDKPLKAEKMIELFSDVVFESILRKNMFLDFIAKNDVKAFQFLEKEVVLVGSIARTEKDVKIYTTTKAYLKSREEEMFDLIQAGAEISDGKLFKKLAVEL